MLCPPQPLPLRHQACPKSAASAASSASASAAGGGGDDGELVTAAVRSSVVAQTSLQCTGILGLLGLGLDGGMQQAWTTASPFVFRHIAFCPALVVPRLSFGLVLF